MSVSAGASCVLHARAGCRPHPLKLAPKPSTPTNNLHRTSSPGLPHWLHPTTATRATSVDEARFTTPAAPPRTPAGSRVTMYSVASPAAGILMASPPSALKHGWGAPQPHAGSGWWRRRKQLESPPRWLKLSKLTWSGLQHVPEPLWHVCLFCG